MSVCYADCLSFGVYIAHHKLADTQGMGCTSARSAGIAGTRGVSQYYVTVSRLGDCVLVPRPLRAVCEARCRAPRAAGDGRRRRRGGRYIVPLINSSRRHCSRLARSAVYKLPLVVTIKWDCVLFTAQYTRARRFVNAAGSNSSHRVA